MYHECGCLYWLASNAFKTIIILLEVAIWLNAVYNLALPIRLHRFGSLLWRELETDIVLRPHQIKHIKRIAYIMLTGYKGREIKNFTFYQNYYYNMAWIMGIFLQMKEPDPEQMARGKLQFMPPKFMTVIFDGSWLPTQSYTVNYSPPSPLTTHLAGSSSDSAAPGGRRYSTWGCLSTIFL